MRSMLLYLLTKPLTILFSHMQVTLHIPVLLEEVLTIHLKTHYIAGQHEQKRKSWTICSFGISTIELDLPSMDTYIV